MSTAARAASLARELAAIAGEQHVMDDAELAAFAIDGVLPTAAVAPGDAEEVAAILRLATGRNLVVMPAGGFTRQMIGAIPERVDILLRTQRLKDVEHYDPGDLTIGVGAGTTLAELDAQLAPHQQWLPVDAARPQAATIGGVLATGAHGPLKHAFGGVREFTIGVRFVTGDGKRAKGGGRVVKNVAGYDLMKLLISSFGTLGVITGASFKLFPRPRQTRTFVCEFASAAEAVRFRDRVFSSPLVPLCLEIVSPHAQEYLRPSAPARSPGHDAPEPPIGAAPASWQVRVRAAGSDAVLARYRRELGGGSELDGEEEARAWRAVSDFGEQVVARHHNAMLLETSVPIAALGTALAAAERTALDYNFLPAMVGRAGVGALVVAFIPLAVDPFGVMQYAGAASALRGALGREGSAVVIHCPREAKPHFSVWGPPLSDVECMRAVKRALDPAGVLNRGRFVV